MTTYAQARISTPLRYFETPSHVLSDEKLSRDDKVKVLKSMADDADQKLEATSEGMAGATPAYNAEELQSALIQLEKTNEPNAMENLNLQNSRFQRIMVVTTVDQDLNREIADVAFDMAEIVGAKVFLLNVVPSAFGGAGLAPAGPMVITVPAVSADDSQIIEDRKKQLTKLKAESDTIVETEIEVRSGQIEEVIVDYAGDCDADLIVVGSPNRSWLETLFDPSVARKVTRLAPCPVLIIPEPA
jgi:nucleotide-binding universal stress UspA family protein